MVNIPGYQINEELHQGNWSLVYRGHRYEDNQPVILKVLRKEYPTSEEIARFKREYEIAKTLNLAGIAKPYSLEKYKNSLVMAMEDFGGESLDKFKDTQRFSLPDFLTVATQIAEILGTIHQQQVIHKDINPSNIVVARLIAEAKSGDQGAWQSSIIDFGVSTVFSRENPVIRNPNVIEGTLAYISPEQTGRMNRAIDYRTDFYSLGITFYELLTQRLPFETTDPMELVHFHIAKQPDPPQALNPEIPTPVSDIIMKLLAKTAEERYQSAWGLKADLEECFNQLQAQGRIDSFPLGRQDVSDKFQIPQKLYGRQQEIVTLLAAFERISQFTIEENNHQPEIINRKSEMMLVSGYAGIGKSALVQEIYKPVTGRRGYFVAGKFDQFQRNMPYSGVVNAFRDLMEQLLTESERELSRWREKLLAAFGPNGQVMIDVIPEVELIVGPQPPVQELGPAEAQNRFNLIFQNFIRVFCQPAHPLVIFLDDLQWVDSATLKLIELMMSDEETGYLFLIGAYRDNEVSPTHPLMISLEGMRKGGAVINQMVLTPLNLEHVTQLVAETLQGELKAAKPLAELVLRKTEGNPFFVNEFLKTLYQEQLLTFMPPQFDKEKSEAGWRWDMAQVGGLKITDNVVNLMIGKLKKLPEATQQVLRLAACIGSNFDLLTLAIVHEKDAAQTFQDLLPAIQEELILSTSALEILGDESIDAPLLIRHYRFAHDRVQQAADALMAEAQKQATHLRIGRLLLTNMPAEERAERIFELIDHLNLGRELITQAEEKFQLARLNLEAGKKAKDAMAYAAAKIYLEISLAGFGEEAWTNHYDFAFALHKELAEVEYLNGNFEQAEALVNLTLTQAKSIIEQAELYNLLIVQNTLRAKYKEAIQAGRQALSLLGTDLPEEELRAALGVELAAAKAALGDREIASLLNEPEMTAPEQKAAMKLLTNLIATAFLSDQALFAVIAVKMVNLSLRYGHVAESAYGYSTYGLLLGPVLGNYPASYAFGVLGVKLSEKFNNQSQKCLACNVLANHINHWVKHIKLAEGINNEGYQAGLASGQLQYAGYILFYQVLQPFDRGENLAQALAPIPNVLRFSQKTNNQMAMDIMLGFQLIVLNVSGLTHDKFTFASDTLSEAQFVERCQQYQSFNALCRYLVLKTQVLYLYDQPAEALACALEAEKLLTFIRSSSLMTDHNFYHSLSLTALYPTAPAEVQPQYWEKLEANQKQMKIWADNSPENFQHKYLLVAAEMARLSANFLEAMDLYHQAITQAHQHEFVQHEALANELIANFWLNQGKEKYAQAHLIEARYGYQLWGAKHKLEGLEEKYAYLQTKAEEAATVKDVSTTTSTSTGRSAGVLDLATVMKASQAISGEIVLDRLLANLMKIVIENAGAQRGFLILEKEGQLMIEAKGSIGDDGNANGASDIAVLQSAPVEGSADLSLAIVNYVARTRENVVLSNATSEGQFIRDPYIVSRQPKSILCAPVLHHAKLMGLLYLENNLTSGAFTPDRLEMLRLLSAQIAISIENASLYTHLQASEKKYRVLFEDSKDTIFITSPAGHIIDINSAGLTLFGYSQAEIVTLNAQDLYADRVGRFRFRLEIEKHGSVRDFELKARRKDGTEIDCLMTATVRRAEDGTILGYEGIMRDITAQKRAERERLQLSAIQQELAIAQGIQQSLLPPARPTWAGLDVIGYSRPAREVGGDLYAYHAFEQNEAKRSAFAIALGDISGKGMPAALLMAVSLASFRSMVRQGLPPSELLLQMDNALTDYTHTTHQNCALIYLELTQNLPVERDAVDEPIYTLRVANAGCVTPLIKRADGSVEWIDATGLPLGVDVEMKFGYEEITLPLSKGDLIVLTSDGVIEANNATNQLFGFDRLEDAVINGPTSSAEAMLEHLKTAVAAFVGTTEPHDDLTIVVVQV